MVFVPRPMADAAVLATARYPSSAMLLSRDLHVLLLPKTVNTLVIHLPLTIDEQTVDPLCSKAWTLPGQCSHLTKQLRLITGTP